MQTGLIENWTGNPLDIGPMYPFVGMEMALFVVCAALVIVYTVWQLKFEARTYDEEAAALAARSDLRDAIVAGAPLCYEHDDARLLGDATAGDPD